MTYNELEIDQIVKAKKQAAEYEKERLAQAAKETKAVEDTYNSAIRSAQDSYRQAADETKGAYRSLYDANAVQELVARRNVEEAMANMGLTNSGLNTTQQTAISLQRGRADNEVTKQRQAAVDSIMRELDQVRSQYAGEMVSAKANIQANAAADVRENTAGLMSTARQNAANMYAAEVEANNAATQAELDREMKLTLALLNSSNNTDANAGSTGQNNLYVTQTGHASVYGSLTTQPYTDGNGVVHTGWDAGKYRVYEQASRFFKSGVWGDTSTEAGVENAARGMIAYLQAQVSNGNLKNEEAANDILYSVLNGFGLN